MPIPTRQHSDLPCMKKSSRFYDFRAELELDIIHDDSTDRGGSDSFSPYMDDSFESGSMKSDIQDVEEFDLENCHESTVEVRAPPLPQLHKSQCFVLILKMYFSLNRDIAPYDLAKLQLLNRRCYEHFVPRAMADLNINL